MAQVINISDTLTFYPVSFDEDLSEVYSTSNLSSAYSASNTTSYATIDLKTGSNANTYAYFSFDTSEIPNGATIISISCSAKAYVSTTNTRYISTRQIQLTTGTTTKGSASTVSNSTSILNLTTGNWTVEELHNAKIRLHITRGTSGTSSTNYYARFYGATLTVSYSYQGTQYTIATTSTASGSTVDPATQEVLQGGTATVRLDIPVLGDVNVTDNNVDIKALLEPHQLGGDGEVTSPLGNYSLVSGSFSSSGASYFSGIVGNDLNSSKTTNNYYSGGSGTIAVFTYDMGVEIPEGATITSITCQVNGHAESTSNNNEYMCARLISGSTNLTEEINWKSIGTSNSTQTLDFYSTPTIAQLANAKLQCRLGYYGGAINGALLTVVYEMEVEGVYYTYTLTNVTADHAILVEEKGVYIPPEEDPEYTYWPITISSINATTNPGTGTTRVVEGTTQVVTISPEDPRLALAMDNGVDITSQLVGGTPNNTYTVTGTAPGASYGFNLNSSTGYYVSTNAGVNRSASVARLNLDLESDALVTIQYINYAEENYDYGMFGKLDTTVATDGLTAASGSSNPSDSTSNYQLARCSNSSSPQTITYEVSAGEHYIDIKYGKDDASDSNNDNLQWKVTDITATSAGGDYTYTLTNVAEKHSLIFVFGDVEYYFVTSTGNSACRLFPDGQQVKLPGDGYRLNIVPNNISAGVTITDNNVDVTTLLQREEGVDKYNNTVVSYSYVLTDIQATHNLIVQVGEVITTLYCKINNTWRPITKAYKKVNGSWVEISDLTTVFSKTKNYRKG